MLTSVDIQNYRGFESYHARNLARVNLFVGKNNSGKTALLEGLEFLISGGDASVLADAAKRRGEIIRKQNPYRFFSTGVTPLSGGDWTTNREDVTEYIDIGHFFHGHELAQGMAFELRNGNEIPPVSAKIIRKEENDTDETEAIVSGRFYSALKIESERFRGSGEQVFRITAEGGASIPSGTPVTSTGLDKSGSAPIAYISPDSLNANLIAQLWDGITLQGSGAEDAVAQSLQIIEPDMLDIRLLAASIHGTRFVVALKSLPHSKRIPLGSLGDGMRRLLALAISLATCPNGFVFVDEIDTGLHYTVLADVWKLVVQGAQRGNIQVFATTHSKDCIEGLHVLCRREPNLMEQVAIHKVDRSLKHSIPFSGESLVKAIEGGVELR